MISFKEIMCDLALPCDVVNFHRGTTMDRIRRPNDHFTLFNQSNLHFPHHLVHFPVHEFTEILLVTTIVLPMLTAKLVKVVEFV